MKLSEHPKEAQVCVPPVEKPEGVTQDEMIEFVLKNTAYGKNEILKREEEIARVD